MKQLSEWQSACVRDALRAFHRYERGIDEEDFTWKDVREAIAEYTGVEIGSNARHGGERLRQFVEGVEDGNAPGGRKYSAPKPATLEAILAFLTHEDLNLLTVNELEEYKPGYQASLRLTEFLRKDCDLQDDVGFPAIAGQYMTGHPHKDGWTIRILFLNSSSEDGVSQVVETRYHYATEKAEEALKWYNESNRDNLLSSVQYGGWAIITPEDSLILFLKHKGNGRNHRYICLDEIGLWDRETQGDHEGIARRLINREMFMLLHDYGHDFRRKKETSCIVKILETDLFVFKNSFGDFA